MQTFRLIWAIVANNVQKKKKKQKKKNNTFLVFRLTSVGIVLYYVPFQPLVHKDKDIKTALLIISSLFF